MPAAGSVINSLIQVRESATEAELFTLPQLESHAQALAKEHRVEPRKRGNKLLARLRQNEKILRNTYELINEANTQRQRIAPASEWLLDNFYLLERQIGSVRKHLPRGYSRELPRMVNGPHAGFPRVYAIAFELISHVDGKIDAANIHNFVNAYQSVEPLRIGELWAVPIMLRLGIIENLRQVAIRVARSQVDFKIAGTWAQRFIRAAQTNLTDVILILADMTRAKLRLSSTFVAEFSRQLQGQAQDFTIAYAWLDQQLSVQGVTREELVHDENQRQAADQISIGNCIESLRALDAIDWRSFVESSSSMERILSTDPHATYAGMDFATRDRYRHIVERTARSFEVSENQVAQTAIACASGASDYRRHVGYYLVDEGIAELERRIGSGPHFLPRLGRGLRRGALGLYCAFIFAVACILTIAALPVTGLTTSAFAFVAVALAISASQFAVSLANWLVTRIVKPSRLPRMDLSKGITENFKAVVVVPCMLSSEEGIADQLQKLEVRFLGNRDSNLNFAILSDFKDSDAETSADDDKLLELAAAGINALNRRYAEGGNEPFFLFHRPRRWNDKEQRWMGYERKRGKLADFNAFLISGKTDPFLRVTGESQALARTKFVITLDADTQLPSGSAHKLIGTLAHPLNRPIFDEKKKRVTRGYSILQPQAAITLPSAQRSWFAQLFGGEPGIDPYSQVVSDVYQDLLGEGSFIGKGIYDLHSFEQALGGKLPENRILSHDLLEGSYARCGLVTDVQLFEDFPSRYLADTARRHRWTRGDWQIARWLLPVVPGLGKPRSRNPISTGSKWKIFDNLRRSLVPIAMVLGWLGAWLLAPHPTRLTLAILLIPILPPVLDLIAELISLDSDTSLAHHVNALFSRALKDLCRVLLNVSFLPYEAWLSVDAIVRTTFRLVFTGRRLLEWTTSSEAEQSVAGGIAKIAKRMWAGPTLAIALVVLQTSGLIHLPSIAAPLIALWIFSPFSALLISAPSKKRASRLTTSDELFLRRLARQVWHFFDRFMSSEDNWLPPDNFQEVPIGIVAHRTSPTNMGLALLANLAAYDLGYITVRDVIRRCQLTLATMQSLDRRRGHFYNWYDTTSLKPLSPLYISTVDSGNLAGHLFTLQRGLLELADQPLAPRRNIDGLRDTIELLRARIEEKNPPETQPLLAVFSQIQDNLTGWRTLPAAHEACAKLTQIPVADKELSELIAALVRQADELYECIQYFAPMTLERDESNYSLRHIAKNGAAAQPASSQEYGFRAQRAIQDLESLAQTCEELAAAMDFRFLYSKEKKLFSIGFNVSNHILDASCYDLLSSEARLASFVAIAEGMVEQEHWFALGRQVIRSSGAPTLISWSGSMFEYLMPLLVMPNYPGTILDQTYEGVVRRQIAYGAERGVPWGISESGYNMTDAHLNYQYRAFGVPGLGLQRGLGDELVIAPYAAVMALMVAPAAACRNLRRLYKEGRAGNYGLYEAVDYTPSRVPPGQDSATVLSYMAHHQGMSLLALDYLLRNRPMQRRFSAEPMFRTADLLLHERAPKAMSAITPHRTESTHTNGKRIDEESVLRVVTDPNSPVPEVHLLSNGSYHLMINAAGSGYSRWKDLAVTRWREDAACDGYGWFCYLRDADSGAVWSSSLQPTLSNPEKYEAIFTAGRIEFRRSDHDIDLHTEIAISAEDDVEIRRMRITNNSNFVRTIELTSYGEVIITQAAADAAHPAFSNLFVESQIDASRESIICTRRPRGSNERPPAMFHSLVVRDFEIGKPTYETNRREFIGRNRRLRNPAALETRKLSGSQGSVLDPAIAIRRTVRLQPRESAIVDLICGIAESVELTHSLVDKYRDQRLADRVFDMAWTHGQVALRQLNCKEQDAQLYAKLAGAIIYASQYRRAPANVLAKNRRGKSSLWAYGISGDLPIVVLRVGDSANIDIVRQCLKAQAYWRMKGLIVDLVLTVDDPSVYRQALYDQIIGMIAAGSQVHLLDKPGGIFVRRAEQISDEDRILLQTAARITLSDADGPFREQVEKRMRPELSAPPLRPTRRAGLIAEQDNESPAGQLLNFNGMGGFSADGSEYVVILEKDRTTPAPWVNVIANPTFGTVVSEMGSAYTWLENSHEYRLTPWSNDPVSDPSGEAFYIRDEETGNYWSPAPGPARGPGQYEIRHGFGYSSFQSSNAGIKSELITYVAIDAPVKFFRLKLQNRSNRVRKISTWAYFEWVLGDLRTNSQLHVSTEVDARSGAILARNPYNSAFPSRIAFVAASRRMQSCSGDRIEFIGRNGALNAPAALVRTRLSNRVGAGLDPCAAMQHAFTLLPDESVELVLELGIGQDPSDVQNLLGRFCNQKGADQALTIVRNFWNETLTAVHVETPDRNADLLANGWLLYQTLACRMWARSGFYQSGGAFGFRDQLQDSMALLHSHPALVRQHLLLAARHQFREGDVQHWWHPPSGRGVRTHISDDYLWLPFAACQYAKITGDQGIFDESVAYIEGRPVNSDEESYYDLPLKSEESGTLYNHCVRAIEHGLRFGAHGLPLIGCGDWNDGMNRVGALGKGESVWLGFFLFNVLNQFEQVARRRGDNAFAERCQSEAARIGSNIEAHAWDGGWYRRAYFDNGLPLGSASSPECQIDSLPQSWSVLSEAGSNARSQTAMEAVNKRLIRRDAKIIQLFDPPFAHSDLDPGYIQGYAPGVRENGGQYTHAALWVIMAFAKLGKAELAWELLALINPVNHSATNEDMRLYQVEPYVIAADVYGVPPHTGRGGWTWYTGSAGWTYRTIIESLLGLDVEGNTLRIRPSIPKHWPQYKIAYRYWDTTYHLTITQEPSVDRTEYLLDGKSASESIVLDNDHVDHQVTVRIPLPSKSLRD